MAITQEQLNKIVDLLGDYVYQLALDLITEFHRQESSYQVSHVNDNEQSHQKITQAWSIYYTALKELYGAKQIPSAFMFNEDISYGECSYTSQDKVEFIRKKFLVNELVIVSNSKENLFRSGAIEQCKLRIDICAIISQLNNDFNQAFNIESQTLKLIYTGTRYQSSLSSSRSIYIGIQVSEHRNLRKTNFYFVMAVLSDTRILILVALLVPVSAGLFSGGVIIGGIISAGAAASIITACYGANKFKFFAQKNEPADNIQINNIPDTLGNSSQ